MLSSPAHDRTNVWELDFSKQISRRIKIKNFEFFWSIFNVGNNEFVIAAADGIKHTLCLCNHINPVSLVGAGEVDFDYFAFRACCNLIN